MDSSLLKKTKNGLIWDLGGSFARQFATFFISIILARILSPSEFGIIGMAMVFVTITQVFIDVGFTQGLIQKQDTSDITYSSIFYINLGVSVIFSVLILITAPFIGEFYDSKTVTNILYFLSIIPPIAALGKVHSAILMKRLDLRSLNIRDVIATAIGGIGGVIAALNGFGVYSLVIQQILSATIDSILLWYSSKWRPKLEFSWNEVKGLLSFSSYIFFDDLLRQVFNRIDIIFIGKFFSPSILGFYSRAESFNAQIKSYTTESIRKVMFPVFSTLQFDNKKLKSTYIKILNLSSCLNTFILGALYFVSNEVIIGLMGKQWSQSVVFFKILIFIALISPQVGLMDKLILAKGYSKAKFKIGLFQRLIKLLPMLFGLYYGIKAFAIVMVITTYIVFIFYMYIIHIKMKISLTKQLSVFFINIFILILFIFIFEFYELQITNYLFSLTFVIINLLYLKIIDHDGYYFVLNYVKKGIKIIYPKN